MNTNQVDDTISLDTMLAGTGVASSIITPNFMDDNNEGRVLGCMNDEDFVYHRSKATNWNDATYGVLPYEQLAGVTLENILEKTHLNWQVEKMPLYTQVGDSKILVPDYYATMRSDTNTMLGVVKGRYNVMQNEELMEVVRPFMDIEDLCIESGGYFTDARGKRPGHRVYIMFKLPGYVTVNGDTTENMLFISNSHDGTSQLRIGLTNVRTVCRNTFQMNIDNASISIRHNSNMDDRVKEAHENLQIVNTMSKQLGDIFNKMAETKVTKKDVQDVIYLLETGKEYSADADLATRSENKLDRIFEWVGKEFESSDACKNTAYGLFNGVTAYYNHGMYLPTGFKKDGQPKSTRKNKVDRFSNIVLGGPGKQMNKALDIICEKFEIETVA